MYNLYQSQLRKDIQSKIYWKESFEVEVFGKKYFGLVKNKKIWFINTKRYQVMWIELPKDEEYIRKEINKIKKIYSKKWENVFFQRGIINEIIRFENVSHRSGKFNHVIKQLRLDLRNMLLKKYKLKLTIRENMPQSDIIYDITKTDEELMKDMNSGYKERVKKAIKNNIEFRIAKPDEYDEFYKHWKELAWHKWFNIIPKEQYNRLIKYMIDNKRGDIFLSHKNGEIHAGSICLYDEHRLIYLYWFWNSANKKLRNMWWHHFLKFKIFGYAREKWFTYVDMMGGAPTGFDDHPLTWVSKFKESLGGIKIEQYGSYDIVLNPFVYFLYKIYLKIKK